jgi:nucleoside-diphosphate-sugar epimerase
MRVFLTGATGYIGNAVLDGLLRAGHSVSALVRGQGAADRIAARGADPVRGDLGSPAKYRDVAASHDAIIHAAFSASARGPALDAQAVDAFLGVAGTRGPSTVIYTSGIWVLGPAPQPATEDTPVHPIDLAAWRQAVEQRVLGASSDKVRTIVIRPGYVYGGARGYVSDMLKDAENGLMRVIGTGDNHWPVVYERDMAELYVRLLATPTASGIYHATDESGDTLKDIVEAIAAHAPARPEVRYMPLAEARKKMGPLADALALDQVVLSPRARALGWAPTLATLTRNVPRLFEEWRNARREETEV